MARDVTGRQRLPDRPGLGRVVLVSALQLNCMHSTCLAWNASWSDHRTNPFSFWAQAGQQYAVPPVACIGCGSAGAAETHAPPAQQPYPMRGGLPWLHVHAALDYWSGRKLTRLPTWKLPHAWWNRRNFNLLLPLLLLTYRSQNDRSMNSEYSLNTSSWRLEWSGKEVFFFYDRGEAS
jgi:hypothetical protein